jgi:hypothetical protein
MEGRALKQPPFFMPSKAKDKSTETERKKPYFKDTVTGEIFQSGGRTTKSPAGNPAIRCDEQGNPIETAAKAAKNPRKGESKGSTQEKLLNLLGAKGVPVEAVMKWVDGDIQTEIKIGGKASKLNWLVEDKSLLEKGDCLLDTSGNQARVVLTLDTILGLIG